jgi:NTP pyrophosphatase (non-canonical NTP hydrolase)
MTISNSQLQRWRDEASGSRLSPLSEATPTEFFDLLDEVERLNAASLGEQLNDLGDNIMSAFTERGWSNSWSERGINILLEAGEFVESMRGKGGDPMDEAGDVLSTFLAMARGNDLDMRDVLTHLNQKLEKVRTGQDYKHKP